MGLFRAIFRAVGAIFRFINSYFKTVVFLTIVGFLIFSGEAKEARTPNLVQIDVKNAIFDSQVILEQIDKASKDDDIKGVLLVVDSPGGALAPSVELKMAVQALNAKKPVLAYAAGNMTSGSYYLSAPASKILANPGAFIGSIGVIIQGANLSELASKIGVSSQVVKAGEFKEAGTFAREWSKAERESLQELVDRSYDMFSADVAAARGLDIKDRDSWANARVFLAADAKEIGLIDGVSDYFSARDELAKMSGVNEPVWREKPAYERALERLVNQSASSFFRLIFSEQAR